MAANATLREVVEAALVRRKGSSQVSLDQLMRELRKDKTLLGDLECTSRTQVDQLITLGLMDLMRNRSDSIKGLSIFIVYAVRR